MRIIKYKDIKQNKSKLFITKILMIMTIQEFYKDLKKRSTPRKAFKLKIAAECGVTETTVRKWLSGDNTPGKLPMEKIAEIAGLPVSELFPGVKEKRTLQQ